MSTDPCDAAAESVACLSLLHDYVEAAYALPPIVNVKQRITKRVNRLPLEPDYEATGCLSFFHATVLPPHCLRTRLASCVLLLGVWSIETIHGGQKLFLNWVAQAGL